MYLVCSILLWRNLGVFFIFILIAVYEASGICGSISLIRVGKFCVTVSIAIGLFLLLSPLGIPSTCMLILLPVSLMCHLSYLL